MTVEEKIKNLNIILPNITKPLGSYTPCVLVDNFAYISGQAPLKENGSFETGVVGEDVNIHSAQNHARKCGLSILAALKNEIGSLDRVEQVVKLTGFVCSSSNFYDQPKVINGCSDLMLEIFGNKGIHARSAVGVTSLPLGISVEIEAIFKLK
ncbi:MAG: RidA family protein [Proteobacteria bacterium]|nr:RidA family protein [Pseudomonadota bacterium]